MKKFMLQGLAFLLAISLLTVTLPIISSAADNELVLTKVGHTSSDTVTISNASTRSVTLTIPFSYTANTLDLSEGLIVDKSSSIDSIITNFTSDSEASIGEAGTAGPPINMMVTYYKGGNTTTQYTTVYTISVVRAAKKNPTFTGTITKSVTSVMPSAKINDVNFTAGDFSDLYTANDWGALTDVSITGSSLSCGSLKIGSGTTYTNYVSGRLMSLSDIGHLVFDASGGGTVSYIVSAYAGGDTAAAIGSVLLTITVNAITVPTINGALTKPVNAGSACTFSLADFSSLYNLHNGTLDTIEIMSANTGSGVWSSGSTAFTGAASFTLSTIGSLKFTGSAAGTAAFTWRVSNEAGFSQPGSGTVTVKTAAVPTITSSVVKSVNLGATLTFSLNDFSSCCSLNNGTLANIVITPTNNNYGTWYKGSNAFTGAKTFNSNDIGTLKFKGTMCGQAAFTWTVSNEKGTSTAGNGYITVNAVTTTITYTTGLNTVKAFTASDFNTACKDATGANLNYMYFTLPSTSCGTLYYGYASPSSPGTAITSNSVLYYNSSPKISTVTFIPATNYTGTFSISYTGVNSNGISYTGYVKMIVGNAGDISYFTTQNTIKTFTASDFNTSCTNVTGTSLSYVYFTLPSSSYGTLYYGYSSPSNPGTAVASNTPYALQNLSFITFVPAANYTGTISIPYTGVAANSVSYTGYIKMTVGSSNKTGSAHFADVGPSYDWAAAAIDFLYAAGIVQGTGSNQYSPGADMTRGDFMLMLYSATGFSASTKSNFSDVPKGSYYYDAIAAAKALGIAKGNNNKFSPNSPLTRQDAMVFIYRALTVTGVTLIPGSSSDISGFTDKGNISSYALTAVKTLVKAGMIKGNGAKLNPTGILSRAEMAVVLYRVKITY